MSFLLQRIAVNLSLVVFRPAVLRQQFLSFMIEHVGKHQHFVIDGMIATYKINLPNQFYIHAPFRCLYIKLLILGIAEIVALIFKYRVVAANSVISASRFFETALSKGLSLFPKFQFYIITPPIALSMIYFHMSRII